MKFATSFAAVAALTLLASSITLAAEGAITLPGKGSGVV